MARTPCRPATARCSGPIANGQGLGSGVIVVSPNNPSSAEDEDAFRTTAAGGASLKVVWPVFGGGYTLTSITADRFMSRFFHEARSARAISPAAI